MTETTGEREPNFVKAFVPGLMLGLVVGLPIGAFVPPLFDAAPKIDPSNAAEVSDDAAGDSRELDRMGEAIDDAVDDVQDAAEDAMDDAKDAIEDAVDDAKDAVDDTINSVTGG